MLILIISLIFGAFSVDQEAEATPPATKESYLEQQYLNYHFDSSSDLVPYSGAAGVPLPSIERKKTILYSYFQLQRAKFSDDYIELLDRIEEIIKKLSKEIKVEENKLLTWDEFKAEYKKQGVQALPFVGYGTLAEKKAERVIGFGAQRKFKEPTPNNFFRGEPTPGYDHESSMMALEETKDYFDIRRMFYGDVFDLKESEVAALQERKKEFQLKKLPIIKMENLSDDPIRVEYAYALIYNHPPKDTAIKPHINYLSVVLSSYEESDVVSQDLMRLFAETTYLADGETTLEQWLQEEVDKYYQEELLMQPIIQKHLEITNKM